jgi:hypothetical protein
MTFIQIIPLTTPTTGQMKIGSARPGVFVENAEALTLAADLRKLLSDQDPSASRKDAVRWFIELCESVK